MTTPYHSRHTGAVIDDAVDRAIAVGFPSEGVVNLADGVSTGTVTGLALTFTPTHCIFQVESPAGGEVMFAVLVRDTLTADGFSFYLSGNTDSANYRLHYRVVAAP